MLGELDERIGGGFVQQSTLLALASRAGYSTAAIGKLGPVLMQDPRARDGAQHDRHRRRDRYSQWRAAGRGRRGRDDRRRALEPPRPRGATTRGPATFRRLGRPRPMSRSRTGLPTSPRVSCCRCSRPGRGRSCWCTGRAIPTARNTTRATASAALQPGINGPTSLAGIRNADGNLRRLREALVVARPCRDHQHRSWRPTTGSPPYRAKASRAPRRGVATPT